MKGKGGNQEQEHGMELDGIITDKRFVHLHSDPRFMRLPRNNSKVSIDSRFHRMFSDKNFSESSSLAFDKRGRPKKKSETNKLHQFYYHLNQDEEEEEKEDGTNEQAEKNEETYTEKTQKKNDEGNTNRQKEETETVGFLSSANSTQKLTKGRKNKNKDREKQGEMAAGFSGNASASEHGHENTDGVEALDTVKKTGVDDPQKKKKKKKKKEQEMDDRFVDLDETLYAKEGHEDIVGTELKEIKKKKNQIKVDEDLSTDEAHENNQAVKLKKKKKRDTKNNNSLATSKEKIYIGEGDVEHVKEKKKQVRAHSEVEARMASASCKSNSNVGSTSKKKRDGSKPKRGGENVSVEEESDVTELSRRKEDIDDRKKLKLKQDSIFGAGRKGSNTVGEFGKRDHGNEEDQETSESESFSDDYFDLSESEENETSSSSDNDDDYGDQIELEFLKQEEVPTLDSETRRLAVVNMDWNHIKAVDLLVCMNCFLPKGGQILTVSVYPSEFGLKRMAEEAVRGPAIFGSEDESSEDDEDELENEKLRQYEKDRLRYYFAVIECDSSATSNYLYKACDGVEFERTSNVLDLRFIPDDMEFDHPPRDVATEVPTNYLAPDFHTRALQHSKVNIAWDDDEPLRVKTLHRKFDPDQLNEMDFKAYLASDDEVSDGDDDDDDDDSQENGEDGENKKKGLREKYRALLLESGDPSEGREDNDDKDMEITFNTGLEDLSKRILEKSKKNNSEETVWEAYLRKRSEKRKAKKKLAERSSEDETSNSDGEDPNDEERDNQSDDFFLDEESLDTGKKTGPTVNSSNMKKAVKKETKLKSLSTKMKDEEDASKAELELLLADDHGFENGVRGYNLKAKKTKGRKRDIPSEDKLPTVDYDDPRFSGLFTSHHFAIDPTDPQFKRSATYSRSIVQKQQKKFADKPVDDLKPLIEKKSTFEDSSTKKRKTELLSLVKSVKRKVGAVDPS